MTLIVSSIVRRARHSRPGRVLVAMGVGIVLAAGASGQSITVSTAQGATGALGETFDLPVMVDMSAYGGMLGSFNITLRWNPTILSLVGATSGTFGNVTVNTDSTALGAVYIAGANPAGVGGLVTIGTARFRPTTLDTTTFTLSVSELYEAGSFTDLLPLVNIVNRQFCPGRGRYGDINGDGLTNSADALIALNNAVGLSVTGDITLGDVDADGDTDPRDALVMLSSGIGLDVSQFRVGTLAPGAACASSGGLTSGITPDTVTVLVGQYVEFSVLRLDSVGVPVAGTNVSYTSSDSSVAVVDSAGVMLAVAAGTATINAMDDSTVTASAAVTVVADRTIHWVDGLATSEVNQLGTTAWPFADVNSAVAVSTPGDTIMLRSGKYQEGILLDQPVVLMGDTASGPPPLITASTSFGTGLVVNAPGNVELHHLQIDTLYNGVEVWLADTLVARDLSFLSNANSFTSFYVDTASAIRISNSDFYGDVLNQGYGGNTAIYVLGHVGLLQVDSVTIANYGYYGIELGHLDSLDLRRSDIQRNYSYGIYHYWSDSTQSLGAVLHDNRITRHLSGAFYLNVVRSADVRNNVFDGGNGAGNYLRGYSATRVSIHGDSIYSDPNYSQYQAYELYQIDSVFIDSVTAYGNAGRIVMQDVRAAVVRDSDFRSGQYSYAIEAYAYSGSLFPTHDVTVRNLTIEGPDSTICARCGYGIYAFDVALDVDSLTASRMAYGIYASDSAATIRNVAISDFGTAVLTSCARVDFDGLVATGGNWALDLNGGCKSGDTILVDNVTIDSVGYGVISNDVPLTVTNSSFNNILYYGLQQYDSAAVVTDNYFQTTGSYYLVYIDVNGDSALTRIERNRLDCTGSVSSSTGMVAYDGPFLIQNDTVIGCWTGVQSGVTVGLNRDVIIRDNYVSMLSAQSIGINACCSYGRFQIVGNTVMGAAPAGTEYGIYLEAPSGGWGRVDSNTVDTFLRAGIWGGRLDTLLIRDNTLLNQVGGTANASGVSGAAGIVQGVSNAASHVLEIRRNRIANSGRSGILLQRDNAVDSVVVLVDSNTVNVAAEYGIGVQNYTNARLQYNAIDSAGLDAISLARLDSSLTFRDTVWVNFNNVTNSGRYGMQNTRVTDFILADNNWWNDALGPSGANGDPGSTGDSVSANIVWSPALTSPANAPIPTAPPAFYTVSVDRSSALLGGSSAGSGATAVTTVREAPEPYLVQPDRPEVPGAGLTEPTAARVRRAPPNAPAWFQQVLRRDAERAVRMQAEYQRDLQERQRQVEQLRLLKQRTGGAR